MVRPPLPFLHALAAGIVLAGCATPMTLDEQVRASGLAPAAVVRLTDDFAVAARADGGRVRVLSFRTDAGGGWTTQELAAADHGGVPSSTHLVSYGGETREDWNSYFYGTAPGEASRVLVDGLGAAGGQVVNGAWVLALRQKDLAPDDMHWRFVDAFGLTIESGSGIGPPVD
jgi:hypothetical protein